MANYEKINEEYNTRITRRLEYLAAATGLFATVQGNEYEKDNEVDAFIAISALNLIKTELDEIVQEMGLLSKVLLSLQAVSEQKQVFSA